MNRHYDTEERPYVNSTTATRPPSRHGPTDVYIPLIDQFGHPLTTFRNGNLIADYSLVIDSPYHCAADELGV